MTVARVRHGLGPGFAGLGQFPLVAIIAKLQAVVCQEPVGTLGGTAQQLAELGGIERADRIGGGGKGATQRLDGEAGVFLDAGQRRGHRDAGFDAGHLGDGFADQQDGAHPILCWRRQRGHRAGLADSGQHFAGNPAFEALGSILGAAEDQCVESRFVDEVGALRAAERVDDLTFR